MDYKTGELLGDAFNRQMVKLSVEVFEREAINVNAIYKMQALFQPDEAMYDHLRRIRRAYTGYSLQTRTNCLDIQTLALALNRQSPIKPPPSVFKAILNGGEAFWATGVRDQYNRKYIKQILEDEMGIPAFRATSIAGDSYSQVWSPEEQKRNNDNGDPVGGHYANQLHNIGLRITWNEPEDE